MKKLKKLLRAIKIKLLGDNYDFESATLNSKVIYIAKGTLREKPDLDDGEI